MPYFFGSNVGAGVGPAAVSEQSTTTSRDVEIVINTNANVPDRAALIATLRALFDYIEGKANKNW